MKQIAGGGAAIAEQMAQLRAMKPNEWKLLFHFYIKTIIIIANLKISSFPSMGTPYGAQAGIQRLLRTTLDSRLRENDGTSMF